MAVFSHITVSVSDLDRAASFYDALLAPLGLIQRPVVPDGGPLSRCWHQPDVSLPRCYAWLPFNGQPCSYGNAGIPAFLAPSIGAVERAYAQGIRKGGTDDGAAGPRVHYGPGYFGAYLRDPAGSVW